MSARTASRLAWSLWGLALALAGLGLLFLILSHSTPVGARFGFRGFTAIFAAAFSTVGALIAHRHHQQLAPTHVVVKPWAHETGNNHPFV